MLEDRDTDGPERLAALARHWLAATRQTDTTKAAYYARRAGQAALAAYAPTDAVTWFSRALETLDRQGLPDQHERARSSPNSAPHRTAPGCLSTDKPSSTRPRPLGVSETPTSSWPRPSEVAGEQEP